MRNLFTRRALGLAILAIALGSGVIAKQTQSFDGPPDCWFFPPCFSAGK